MRVGSLFAGIGGFDLGLERAGMRTAWQVELEPWCQHILNKHWPTVPVYADIRDVKGADVEPVDVLCGGFPCQDISNAGKRAGIEGARSSLWKEYARLVGELRPRYVVVENVAALRRRGLDVVLGDLATLGYDAEWDCIRAADVGAHHLRNRLWLVAYPQREQLRLESRRSGRAGGEGAPFAAVHGEARCLADPEGQRPQLWPPEAEGLGGPASPGDSRRVFGDRDGGVRGTWAAEPDVGRVADGVPARVDRLRGLGNALVPQIAEWIGRRILAYEAAA